ncbi:MAG TPA: hypothetical protein VED59_04650, partial [Acidimicrobiales bacterium]|nr:hypothetical protein [Acidimicrobiales bacterium]
CLKRASSFVTAVQLPSGRLCFQIESVRRCGYRGADTPGVGSTRGEDRLTDKEATLLRTFLEELRFVRERSLLDKIAKAGGDRQVPRSPSRGRLKPDGGVHEPLTVVPGP